MDGDDTVRDGVVFVILCGMVFGLAFVFIPHRQETVGRKNVDRGVLGDAGEEVHRALPKEEQTRLRHDIETIERQIAAKDTQGAETFAPQYVHMGGIYETLQLFPQARNAYIRATTEDTKNIDAFNRLLNFYYPQ